MGLGEGVNVGVNVDVGVCVGVGAPSTKSNLGLIPGFTVTCPSYSIPSSVIICRTYNPGGISSNRKIPLLFVSVLYDPRYIVAFTTGRPARDTKPVKVPASGVGVTVQLGVGVTVGVYVGVLVGVFVRVGVAVGL